MNHGSCIVEYHRLRPDCEHEKSAEEQALAKEDVLWQHLGEIKMKESFYLKKLFKKKRESFTKCSSRSTDPPALVTLPQHLQQQIQCIL